MVNHLITEKQLSTLLEALEQIEGTPLYHHTSEERALSIMKQDKLRGSLPSEDYLELDPRLKNTSTQQAISLTRDKNFIPGLSIGSSWEQPKDLNVIFVLDSNKLKTKYKVEPFNYTFLDPNFANEPYEKNPEHEERVLTSKIQPLHKYITDIIYKGNNPEVAMAIDEYLNKDFDIETLNELAPHSSGVQEFLNRVKETPGLLKFLGFRSHKSLENYITEGGYEDFEELKDDANKFEETIKEGITKTLPVYIKKNFQITRRTEKTEEPKKRFGIVFRKSI